MAENPVSRTWVQQVFLPLVPGVDTVLEPLQEQVEDASLVIRQLARRSIIELPGAMHRSFIDIYKRVGHFEGIQDIERDCNACLLTSRVKSKSSRPSLALLDYYLTSLTIAS